MSNQDKKEIVKSSKGKFFVCEFVKKDGTVRKMVARLGVKKGVKGTGKPLSEDSTIMRVFDIQKKAFRSINLDTLISFKCGNLVIA